jgi:hypothetical protein
VSLAPGVLSQTHSAGVTGLTTRTRVLLLHHQCWYAQLHDSEPAADATVTIIRLTRRHWRDRERQVRVLHTDTTCIEQRCQAKPWRVAAGERVVVLAWAICTCGSAAGRCRASSPPPTAVGQRQCTACAQQLCGGSGAGWGRPAQLPVGCRGQWPASTTHSYRCASLLCLLGCRSVGARHEPSPLVFVAARVEEGTPGAWTRYSVLRAR